MAEAKGSKGTPDGTLPTMNDRPPRAPRPGMGGVPGLLAGAVLGKYQIVRPLGAGGMGAVYEAVHVDIGKPVALKVLSSDLASDPRAHARFLQEARAASRLEHAHVVNVTDFGSEGGFPFLVMELLRGQDLGQFIDEHPRGLGAMEAVDILLPVCAAVQAAHDKHIIHRDLKPQNIFLARTGERDVQPKVLDFGISRIDDGTTRAPLTDSGAVVGTVQYLAPEYVSNGVCDALSDQFSLAVVLYECLTGRCPHEGHTPFALMKNITEGNFFPPSALRKDVPPELERHLLRAMSRQPAERFASLRELGKALLPFASKRKRLTWSEQFDRDALDASLSGTGTGPLPAVVEAVTQPAPRPAPGPRLPLRETATSPRAAYEADRGESRAPREEAQPASAPTRKPGRLLGLVALTAVAAAAGGIATLFVFRGDVAPNVNAGLTTSPPTPASPAPPAAEPPSPAASQPATSPAATARATPPAGTPNANPAGEVTIRVEGAPGGTRAFVDGRPASLPLRLPRESRDRQLRFEAPGHEAVELTLVPLDDRELPLKFRPLAAHPSMKGGTRRTASRPAASGRTAGPAARTKASKAPPTEAAPLRPISDI